MSNDRTDAANTVAALALAGVVAIGAGTVLAVNQWPSDSGYGDDAGSALAAYIGVTVAGLGQLALLVAVIAWAVTLGIRWSGLTSRSEAAPLDAAGDQTYLDEDGR